MGLVFVIGILLVSIHAYAQYSYDPGATVKVLQQVAKVVSQNRGCTIGCPFGWNKWGPFTKNCYFLPPQPWTLNNFWNQWEYCKQKELTSYPLVINDLVEQALATAVALQYAPSYALSQGDAFFWLGGYVDNRGTWVLADGNNPHGALMLSANIVGEKNGTCLAADPKLLGVWMPRPCTDNQGAVICEMAPRPICDGQIGGIVPVASVDLKAMKAQFPDLKNIPFLGEMLGSGSLLGFGQNTGK